MMLNGWWYWISNEHSGFFFNDLCAQIVEGFLLWLRDRLFQVVFPCSLGPWPSDCWGPASSAQSPATSPRLPWQTWCRVEIRGVSWVAMGYLTTDLCDVHGMLMGKQWNSAIFAQAQMHPQCSQVDLPTDAPQNVRELLWMAEQCRRQIFFG